MQKQMCHFSKVFGYYNCVIILLYTIQFYECSVIKRIHAMRTDTWINFTPSHNIFYKD